MSDVLVADQPPQALDGHELLIGRRRFFFSRDHEGKWSHNRKGASVASLLAEERAGRRGDLLVWALNCGILPEDNLRGANRALSRRACLPAPEFMWAHMAMMVKGGIDESEAENADWYAASEPWDDDDGMLMSFDRFPKMVEGVPGSKGVVAGMEGVFETLGSSHPGSRNTVYARFAYAMADLVLTRPEAESGPSLDVMESLLLPVEAVVDMQPVTGDAHLGVVARESGYTYLEKVLLAERLPPGYGLRINASSISEKALTTVRDVEVLGRKISLPVYMSRLLGPPSGEYLEVLRQAAFGPRFTGTSVPWLVLACLAQKFDLNPKWVAKVCEGGPPAQCTEAAAAAFEHYWGEGSILWSRLQSGHDQPSAG